MGKARVTPLKPVMIPRLELMAALLSVRVSASLREELEYDQITEVFYTDSQVVLGYIKNDARRFHVFVANRVQQIRENSTPDQWKYIETKENPADESSRGLSPQDLVNNSRWLSGPPFLWERELPKRNEEEEEQKMANLPEHRLKPAPPFTHCGVDYFGPFVIKEGRKELKRYGVLFT